LREISRVPVCSACIASVEPLSAEYFCSACRTPFQNRFPLDEDGLCPLCRLGVRGFDSAHCFGSYEGVLRELIHIYKYGKVRTMVRPLGNLLARALARNEHYDLVTPVPLHWHRRWQRGFNQAELLARDIARRAGIGFTPTLRRVRSTSAQAGLSNTARRRNVAAAFACRRSLRAAALRGKRVLLIDDVMTTGSTAAACARVLKQAGAARVALLTVARVDRRMDFTYRAGANGLSTGGG
jgi:ComF family protein